MEQQSIKKNTVYNAIKTVSSILFPLITFPYISRVFLPENVGIINFGTSIVAYFSLIASLGINTYAIRECSSAKSDRDRLSNIASQIFSINLITTFLAYIILAIALIVFPKLRDYRMLIIIQSISIIASTLGADWINSAMEDFKYITIRTVLFQVVSVILMLIFVHKPEDYICYAIIGLISSIGASISNIWYRKKYCSIKLIKRIKTGIDWKHHIKPIFFLFVMILAQSLFNNVDVTMIGIIKGNMEVGYYSTAHKVENIIAQIIVSSAWVVMPRISKYYSSNEFNRINLLLSKIFSYFVLIGLPCIVGTICLSKEIIQIIAGKAYSPASTTLCILMIGYIFDLFGNSFLGNIVCLPLKQEKKYMLIWVFASIINIILNYYLIPTFGASAAALTTAISYFFSLIALIITVDKNIRIKNKFKATLSPTVGCLGIMISCYLGNNIENQITRIILKIGLSFSVYITVQFLMKNQQFMEIFYEIKKRRKGH